MISPNAQKDSSQPFQHICLTNSTIANPIITIAIPTFNRMDVLHRALESAMNQDFDFPYEIVIVDNASDTSLNQNVKDLIGASNGKVAYYRNVENIGMFNNWTQCFHLAKGQWVTLLSDDDLLDPSALASVHPHIGGKHSLIFGLFDRIDVDTHEVVGEGPVGNLQAKIERFIYGTKTRSINAGDWLYACETPPGLVGTFFRRDRLLAVGGFDPSNYPCADYYALYEFTRRFGSALKVPRRLGFYCMGINEYLRKDVMLGFVKMNLRLRRRIVAQTFGNRFPYKIICTLLSAIDAGVVRKFDDVDDIDIGVSKIARTWIAQRFCQVVMLIINLFRLTIARLQSTESKH